MLSPADNLLTAWPWKSVAPDAVPANPLLADVSAQLHPWLIYAAREIAEGRFPLWNPHAFGGAPLFGAAQAQLLFPLNALAYVLPATLALTLIAILKTALAGLTMYWFLRGMPVAGPAALLGALAFMWSAAMVVWLHSPFTSGLAIVPVVLGAIHRLRTRGGTRWIAVTAVAVALVILAGYPQGLLYTVLVALAWALTLAPGAPGGPWRFLGGAGAGIALGVVLGAVQLVPFVEYLRESAVTAYRAEWVPFMRLPARAIVTLFLPQYYGTPGGRDYWGPFNFHVIAVAVGVAPWLVLPVAVVAAWRDRAAAFFVVLAAFSAAMLYGAPGAQALAQIPPFSMTGNLRFGALLVVALAVLAGLGADAIARADAACRRQVAHLVRAGVVIAAALPLFFVATAILALSRDATRVSLALQYAWWLAVLVAGALCALCWLRDGRVRWAIGLAAVQLASTLPLGATYNPVIDTRLFYPEPRVLGALRAETARDGSRVLTGANNVSMLYGLSEPTGYDALTPRRIEAIAGPIGATRTLGLLGTEPLTAAAVFSSPALDLMAVRHLLVPPGMSPGARFALAYDGPDARVFRNDGAVPRAMLVARGRCAEDAEAIRLIRERRIDVRREVLLAPPCAVTAVAEPEARDGRVTIREHRPDVVVVDAVTDAPAYLVLADTWFPGWEATVGDAPAPILRANHAFRAVRLERGTHVVRFEYRPRSVRLGLVTTIAGAVLVAGLLVIGRRRPP